MTWEMLKNDVAYAARKEGLEEGRAEGEKIGASKEKTETALRMQKAGKSIEDILIATGMTEDELRALKD